MNARKGLHARFIGKPFKLENTRVCHGISRVHVIFHDRISRLEPRRTVLRDILTGCRIVSAEHFGTVTVTRTRSQTSAEGGFIFDYGIPIEPRIEKFKLPVRVTRHDTGKIRFINIGHFRKVRCAAGNLPFVNAGLLPAALFAAVINNRDVSCGDVAFHGRAVKLSGHIIPNRVGGGGAVVTGNRIQNRYVIAFRNLHQHFVGINKVVGSARSHAHPQGACRCIHPPDHIARRRGQHTDDKQQRTCEKNAEYLFEFQILHLFSFLRRSYETEHRCLHCNIIILDISTIFHRKLQFSKATKLAYCSVPVSPASVISKVRFSPE